MRDCASAALYVVGVAGGELALLKAPAPPPAPTQHNDLLTT
jgi:hypothetical protein